jgi:hypothetical protein
MSKKVFKLGDEADNPNNFFNSSIHIDKIEECKVYGKNGELIKKISPKEQMKTKWDMISINPLIDSVYPSRESKHKGKRKQGQQKNRADISINFRSVFRTS